MFSAEILQHIVAIQSAPTILTGFRTAIQFLCTEGSAGTGVVVGSAGDKLFLNGKLNRGFETVQPIEQYIGPPKGTGLVRRKAILQDEKHTRVLDALCIGPGDLLMEILYGFCRQRFGSQRASNQCRRCLSSRRRIFQKETFKGIGSIIDANFHTEAPEFFSQAKGLICLVSQIFVQLNQRPLRNAVHGITVQVTCNPFQSLFVFASGIRCNLAGPLVKETLFIDTNRFYGP